MKGIAQVKQLDTLIDLKSSLAAKVIAVIATIALATSCFSISSLAFADDEGLEPTITEESGEPEILESEEESEPEGEGEGEGEPESESDDEGKGEESSEDSGDETESSVMTAAEVGDEETPAEINSKEALQAAIDAAQDGVETTITLQDNIETADIVTIPASKNIVLNMAGHRITVASDFSGRVFVNNGTLTVTGNGTIDASMGSNRGAYGAINNFGTLTIENGTFRGNSETNAANIRTYGQGSSLIINGGTFDTSSTAVLVYDSTAVLNGGTYSTHDHNCSSCGGNWAYVVRTFTDGGELSPSLIVNGGSYTGTQGALSASTGYLEVNGGYFKTTPCAQNHNSMFYALYAAGEYGDVKAVINGGTFENTGTRVAVLLGNDNTNGDGGINADAVSHIYAGTFISKGSTAVKVSENTAKASMIHGGTFSGLDESAKAYIDADMILASNDEGFYVIGECTAELNGNRYATLQDAIDVAQPGDTVTLMKDVTIDSIAGTNQATIIIPAGVTLDGANHTITAGTFANAAHMLGVNNAEGVTIKNLTVDMSKATNSKHALNVWGAGASVKLNHVELKGANSAGLVLNAGKVDSDATITRDNGWYGINVDKGGTLTGVYNCFEETPIYSEDAAAAGGSTIKVKTYKALYALNEKGSLAVIYNSEDKAVAKIGTQLFASLPAAVEVAQSSDTVTLLNNTKDVVINKSVKIDLNGKAIDTITVVGNNKLREVTATLNNGTIGSIEVNSKGKIDLWSISANQIVANDGLVAIQEGGEYGDISVSGKNGKLYTTSGTFTGDITFDGAGTMQIRGGEFARDVSKYCQKGYETPETANENGKFVVHQIKIVTDEAVAPTCSATGLTEGSHCATCGKVQKAQEEVDKIAHTEEIDAAVDATCTEPGLTEGSHCSVCGEILAAQEEVAAKGHTKETISGNAATCTEPGLTDGVKCSECDEVLTAQEETPVLGHEYGEWVVLTPAAAGVAGEQQRTCTRCGEVETQAIEALPANPQDNADNQGGNTTDNGNQQQGNQGGTQQGGQQAAAATTTTTVTAATTNADQGTIIADDENPLAAGTDEDADEDAATADAAEVTIQDDENALASFQDQDSYGWLQWLIIPAIVLVAGLLFLLLARHRKLD